MGCGARFARFGGGGGGLEREQPSFSFSKHTHSTQNSPPPPLSLHHLQGALVMPLMSKGFKRGTIKFVVVTARKPE